MSQVNLHPALDKGITKGSASFAGGTLVCKCSTDPVKVKISSPVLHNHACGCTKCWKPKGANMSVVGVVPTDKVQVLEHGEKLAVVDPSALIQRKACKACSTHMYGPVEKDHAFKGLSFIHSELFQESGAAAPEFAAFVSSMIEGGVPPKEMEGVRGHLKQLSLPYYDCLSPALMDMLATFSAKAEGTLKN